jgi:sugar phosphate permease
MLGLGTAAQSATSSFVLGVPMLVPALRDEDGISLFHASLLVSAPTAGLLFTLILWGALADRYGERLVIVTGVGGSAIFIALAAATQNMALLVLLLVLAGALGASVNAASGRLVMGWFPAERRGLAMGIRQMALPLGTAIAGLVLPPLAAAHSARVALLFPAVFAAVSAVAVFCFVVDPPRTPHVDEDGTAIAAPNPYRGSWLLPRLHCSSALLVVPQFVVSTFMVVYLVEERGWSSSAAGRAVFAFQLAGAFGRIGSGVWSDRVGSRLRPMRQLAVASAACMVLLAIGAWTHSWITVLAFGFGAVITVADNGLGYTSVAEFAGPHWSGRALGTQNTVQNFAAMITAPAVAAVIGQGRYSLAFVLTAAFPIAAVWLTPVYAEKRRARVQVPTG